MKTLIIGDGGSSFENVARLFGAVLVLIASASPALTATIVVGNCIKIAGQPTIQAGVDAANDGDTVLVCPGTYFENISIEKNITLSGVPSLNDPVIEYPGTYQYVTPPGAETPFCPLILVTNSSDTTLKLLKLDGSAFNNIYCEPLGMAFVDSSVTV